MKIKQLLITLIFLTAFSQNSIAKEYSEIWKCSDMRYSLVTNKLLNLESGNRVSDPTDVTNVMKAIVIAKVDKTRTSGEIDVSGVTHVTTYEVEGFDRRWDFGSDPQYGFFISPTGAGNYYEFKDDGPVEPTMSLQCWESKEQ